MNPFQRLASLVSGPIALEQAVYGSFAFWDRGYAFLSHSPGCRLEWLKDLSAACQRLGERPPGSADVASILALRLPSGPWAIVQAQPQGADDRGRPGAMAFHAILVPHRDYVRSGGDPFAFAGLFRSSWSAGSESEPLRSLEWWSPTPSQPGRPDPRADLIAQAIRRRKRVAIESAEPIDGLARAVWSRLPPRVRGRASLATWAFGNGNRFDLLAVPRLAAAVLDRTYLDPADPRLLPPLPPVPPPEQDALPEPDEAGLHVHVPDPENVVLPGVEVEVEPETPPVASAPARPATRVPAGLRVAIGAALVLGALAWAIGPSGGPEPGLDRLPTTGLSPPVVPAPPDPTPAPGALDRPPAIAERHRRPLSDRDRSAVVEILTDLADKLGLMEPAGAAESQPGRILERIVRSTRYQGSTLDGARLDDLRARPDDPDAVRLLDWDRRIRAQFSEDRPLPPGFAEGPLAWQLDVALWACHGPLPPGRSAVESATALADRLHLDRPATLSPSLARDPIAVAYAAFLERLPRR